MLKNMKELEHLKEEKEGAIPEFKSEINNILEEKDETLYKDIATTF